MEYDVDFRVDSNMALPLQATLVGRLSGSDFFPNQPHDLRGPPSNNGGDVLEFYGELGATLAEIGALTTYVVNVALPNGSVVTSQATLKGYIDTLPQLILPADGGPTVLRSSWPPFQFTWTNSGGLQSWSVEVTLRTSSGNQIWRTQYLQRSGANIPVAVPLQPVGSYQWEVRVQDSLTSNVASTTAAFTVSP